MPAMWMRTSRRFLSFLVLCLTAQHSLAGSSAYHQSVTVGPDGTPSLQLTNDSDVPITAFIMVEFPSLGMEGRTYFDVYTSPREQTIPPGASVTRGLSFFPGSDVSKVRAEVRAVIFKDGSSAGDPVWINAVLARRVRFYDRTLGLHDLLSQQVGTGISREGIVDMLRASQADAEKQLPDDDLPVMDTVAFYGAISTFDVAARQAKVDVALKVYLDYLEKRALLLEYSRPDLDTIRTLPVTTPKPLSEASLPADFRAKARAFSSSAAGGGTAPSSLSSCTVFPADSRDIPTPTLSCADSGGTEVTVNNDYSFKMTFSQYNANTNKTTPVTWSSPANQGPFASVGVCVAFNDCEDASDVYYIQGTANGVGYANTITLPFTVYSGQNAQSFYWLLDRYPYPTFSQCDECDINPAGKENPISTDAPVPSTKWSFNYSCSVSP